VRVRPYNCERFEVDIGPGDISKESGQTLIVGRPRGIVIGGQALSSDAFEEFTCPLIRPQRRVLRYTRADIPWRDVFSFHYRAERRLTPPQSESDEFIHYLRLTSDLELFLHHLYLEDRFSGDCTIGIVPFSWRAPAIVSHATAQALASLFFMLLSWPRSNRTLRVVIRSLTEPSEFYEVFSLDYYARFLQRRGFCITRRDVWYPHDAA
jgi:hypothetical protein